MKSMTALDEFQEIIQQYSANTSFCESELRWIESRKNDWDFDRIRVGVIGVTSSGKSTLINAILGTDILSSAIAPSSGQLVCCSYGEKPKIIIHFEDGTSLTLSGKEYDRKALEQYSDERFNPQNEKGVLSIELTSPLFDFGKDVLLVDSPGLDAFGLESHERLTLESLVPTMDACIYVTTMKTNSDRKTQEILNTVAKYNCPIIIVQNMLDAVRPSPSGDKTSAQVAADHKARVRRIVDTSSIADKNAVQIIQISAEHAKRWRSAQVSGITPTISEASFNKSNYRLFVNAVTRILEVQRPRIEQQRLMSILAYASALEASVHDKVNKPAALVEDRFPLEDLKAKTLKWNAVVQEKYQKIFTDYESAAEKIRIAIGVDPAEGAKAGSNSGPGASIKNIFRRDGNYQSLEEGLKSANEAVAAFEGTLAGLISDHNTFVISAAEQLNIPSRDLLCSNSLHSFRAVTAEKTTETRSRKVEKSGAFSGAARVLGKLFHQSDWGYEYESYEEVVTDTEKTKKKICERLSDAYTRYTKSMADWEKNNFTRAMHLIDAEIQRSEDSYQRKKAAAVEMDVLVQLDADLKAFIDKISNILPVADFSTVEDIQASSSPVKKIDVDPYIESLLGLSRTALQRQHRATMRSLLNRIDCKNYTPIIVTWDEGSKDEFLWQSGISDAVVVHSPADDREIPSGKNRCLFVLVNAIQYGAALKQISKLKLKESLSKRDYVVWVVQDFQEILNSDRAAEALSQMAELTDVTQIPCESTIYIMHNNPIYNIAFLKSQFDRSLRLAPHKLINELQTKYWMYSSPKVSGTLGEIISKVDLR